MEHKKGRTNLRLWDINDMASAFLNHRRERPMNYQVEARDMSDLLRFLNRCLSKDPRLVRVTGLKL